MVAIFNIEFKDSGHLGFPIRMILATFDLQVTSILPLKFESTALLLHGKKVQNRSSTCLLRRPSWVSDQNDFSYFLPTSHPDTSYQVLSQWALNFYSGEEVQNRFSRWQLWWPSYFRSEQF